MQRIISKLGAVVIIITLFFTNCQNSESVTSQPETIINKYSKEENKAFIDKWNETIRTYSTASKVDGIDDSNKQLKSLGFTWYTTYGQLVETKIDSSYPEFLERKDSAIKILEKYQAEMFPKFRSAFAAYTKKLLWEDDCEAKVEGVKNEILVLAGNYFLLNKNKESTFGQLKSALEKYRFKRLVFRWYMSDEDKHQYEINSEADTNYISMTE